MEDGIWDSDVCETKTSYIDIQICAKFSSGWQDEDDAEKQFR